MSSDVRSSAGAFALASFKLAQATQAALIDARILTRQQVVDAIRDNLTLGHSMAGADGEQARALLEGIVEGYKRNDPTLK